ncbi:MAG: bifunctional precorrin-2 dehydrogenase/sirohydrochlorin ferrochelatase [Candidatus Bathyarchaeia archaeon]
MLIDFKFSGREVLVIGGGRESYRKILKFLEDGAKVKVVSRTFTDEFKKLQKSGRIELLWGEVKNVHTFIEGLKPKPFLLIAATDDRYLNTELAVKAREAGCMVYAIDNPAISDFTIPAIANLGEVKVAISTSGKSPAMAGIIRRRIEEAIREEDILKIRLLGMMRKTIKEAIPDQRTRKVIIYEILESPEVLMALREGKFDEAYSLAKKIIEDQLGGNLKNNR